MILFLDFDGVLHPQGRSGNVDTLFQSAPLIWTLLARNPDVEVVLATSWREDYPFDELREFCTYGGGEQYAERIIGVTPVLEFEKRGFECKVWMDENRPFDTWLAIDDDASLYDSSSFVYVVDSGTGLQMMDIDAIQELIDAYRTPTQTCYNL